MAYFYLKIYGNIKPGDSKSIMELEWDEAIRNDIPQIVFIEKEVVKTNILYSYLKRESREDVVENLKSMDYDNPEKLMDFLKNFIKLRKSKKRKDNWYWGFDIDDPNKFINSLIMQIKYYITQFENPSLLNKGNMEIKLKKIKNRFDILIKEIPDKIFNLQKNIRNYSFIKSGENLKVFTEMENLLEEINSLITDDFELYKNQWEGPIKTDHSINLGGVFFSGGIVDVIFNCNRCGEILFSGPIEVPRPNFQEDSVSKSRVFGDSEFIECICGAEFEIVADSTHGDWDINFEEEYNPPIEFYYKITHDLELEANYMDYIDEIND